MIQATIRKGRVVTEQVPAPTVTKGRVLIKVAFSCISPGTELAGVKASAKSLIQRAMEQPEKVANAINRMRAEGVAQTLKQTKARIAEPQPIGYSLSGTVVEVGDGVDGLQVGDRVGAAGAGLANHAEYVNVPANLVVKAPDELPLEYASTITLGGIALQGVRRADLALGEICAVVGVGVLGLITVQLLVAAGVRVIAVDIDSDRLELAKQFGAEGAIKLPDEDQQLTTKHLTGGAGVDAVLFTAATSSSEPLSEAFRMCRKKGRVVLVGVAGMQINREDMYAKELDLKISTSYGPGRYDDTYEQQGMDYPYPYVRWTENRNMSEYFRLVSRREVHLEKLITQIHPIEDVSNAYAELEKEGKKPLLSILKYESAASEDGSERNRHRVSLGRKAITTTNSTVRYAVVGAGAFASNVHLPNFQKLSGSYQLKAVVHKDGLKAKNVGVLYNAEYVTTSLQEVLDDEQIDLIVITTGHLDHAEITRQALQKGKHVFVEKPLAISTEQLDSIKSLYNEGESELPLLFVGFNRRYSPHIQEIAKKLNNRKGPVLLNYRMNAGYLPPDHKLHKDGGRIIGECCHIIDLAQHLIQSEVKSFHVESLDVEIHQPHPSDNKSIGIKFKDGSVANIQYFSTGAEALEKEYLELHFEGKSIVCDGYKSTNGYGVKLDLNTKEAEKGHFEELEVLHKMLAGKTPSVDAWEYIQATELSLMAANENL